MENCQKPKEKGTYAILVYDEIETKGKYRK